MEKPGLKSSLEGQKGWGPPQEGWCPSGGGGPATAENALSPRFYQVRLPRGWDMQHALPAFLERIDLSRINLSNCPLRSNFVKPRKAMKHFSFKVNTSQSLQDEFGGADTATSVKMIDGFLPLAFE